ncbi:MAG: class I SAM-dependent methyltransferase [Acidimicrobiales bacterium]
MRHNRSTAFEAARRERPNDVTGWSDIAADPNDPRVIAHRARTLQAAWRPGIADRVRFLSDRCRDKNVLDIGCVAHDEARLGGDDWLHGHIARAAARCVGVDILADGVAAVNAAGFDAVVHDLTAGLGPLADRGPFDVIVAGELIEHVPDLDMVFRVAAEGLSPDGELILTTPNPYAPQRVRAGQLGIVWENVDHVSYLFPSGIAELAERRGLRLAEAATVDEHTRPGGPRLQRLKRTIRGSHWRNVGFATTDDAAQTPVDSGPIGRTLRGLARPRRRFLGETFVYVVRRHVGPGPSAA